MMHLKIYRTWSKQNHCPADGGSGMLSGNRALYGKSIAKIETAILSALENTPPELYADIVNNGIYLAGGGALLRGLDKRLTDKINIPFHIAEDPLLSVAKGTGIALKNVDRFSFLMR